MKSVTNHCFRLYVVVLYIIAVKRIICTYIHIYRYIQKGKSIAK